MLIVQYRYLYENRMFTNKADQRYHLIKTSWLKAWRTRKRMHSYNVWKIKTNMKPSSFSLKYIGWYLLAVVIKYSWVLFCFFFSLEKLCFPPFHVMCWARYLRRTREREREANLSLVYCPNLRSEMFLRFNAPFSPWVKAKERNNLQFSRLFNKHFNDLKARSTSSNCNLDLPHFLCDKEEGKKKVCVCVWEKERKKSWSNFTRVRPRSMFL